MLCHVVATDLLLFVALQGTLLVSAGYPYLSHLVTPYLTPLQREQHYLPSAVVQAAC